MDPGAKQHDSKCQYHDLPSSHRGSFKRFKFLLFLINDRLLQDANESSWQETVSNSRRSRIRINWREAFTQCKVFTRFERSVYTSRFRWHIFGRVRFPFSTFHKQTKCGKFLENKIAFDLFVGLTLILNNYVDKLKYFDKTHLSRCHQQILMMLWW